MIFSRISKVAWWVSNFFPKKLIFRIFCDQVLKWKFPSFDGHLEKNIFSWKTFLQNFARFRTFPSLSPPTQCVGDSNYEHWANFTRQIYCGQFFFEIWKNTLFRNKVWSLPWRLKPIKVRCTSLTGWHYSVKRGKYQSYFYANRIVFQWKI